MPIFHFYFTAETIFAREFWTKPFPPHPLSNYHLLFTSGILVIHTHWDMYMPFSFHLVRLWVALENISARGRKQGTVTEEEYTEKSWDVRISFVPLMFLSIWIIIIWIVGVPPNNEKIPGIFFFMKNFAVILQKRCAMGRALCTEWVPPWWRLQATVMCLTIGLVQARQSQMFASGFLA